MKLKNSEDRYGAIAQILHWGMLILFVALYFIAESMEEMPRGSEKFEMFALHKSLGVTAMLLVLARIGWRFVSPPPAADPTMNPPQQKLAGALHILLYICMFAMPVSGYVMSMAGGHPIEVFGLFSLPDLVGESHDLKEFAEEAHEVTWVVIMILVGLHAAAALFHHFVARDSVLRRMLPGGANA